MRTSRPDYFPSSYVVGEKKPGVTPAEEILLKECRKCGASFTTKCRIRKRCDNCQTIVAAEKQKKANERVKQKRIAGKAASRAKSSS